MTIPNKISLGLSSRTKDIHSKKDWVPNDHLIEGTYRIIKRTFGGSNEDLVIKEKYTNIVDPDTNELVGKKFVIFREFNGVAEPRGGYNRTTIVADDPSVPRSNRKLTNVSAIVIFLCIDGHKVFYADINTYQRPGNGNKKMTLIPKNAVKATLNGRFLEVYNSYDKEASFAMNPFPYNSQFYFWVCDENDEKEIFEKIASVYRFSADNLSRQFEQAKFLDDNFLL